MAAWPRTLVLAGAGKMGGALLRGWIAGGLDPAGVHVLDPHCDAATAAFCEANGMARTPPEAAPDVLVLAVKPQTFAADPGSFAPLAGPATLALSILAGTTLAKLRAGLPEAGAIVRAMPNLPASVERGITALASEPGLSERARAVADTLLRAAGLTEWLPEALIDAVTAVSGSGPAYVFLLAEALAEAGEAAGLPRDVAARLARATVEGAGALMAAQPDVSAAALREAVTSPGGTTAAALGVLRAPDGLPPLLAAAVAAAKRRGRRAGRLRSPLSALGTLSPRRLSWSLARSSIACLGSVAFADYIRRAARGREGEAGPWRTKTAARRLTTSGRRGAPRRSTRPPAASARPRTRWSRP